MRFIIEYIFNTQRDWSVWYQTGVGLKTNPLTFEQYDFMDKKRQAGDLVFFKIEVIK